MIADELDKLSEEQLQRLLDNLDAEEVTKKPKTDALAGKRDKLDKMIHYLNPENNPLLTIPKSLEKGVLSGLTVGGYKHIPAAIEYAKGKKSYSEAFKEQERKEKEAEEKHPNIFGGGKLLSSLVLPFKSATLPQAMASGAAYGALEKLVNTNPEDINRMKVQDEAITGAGAGAIGKGVSKAISKAAESEVGKSMLKKLGLLRKQLNPNFNEIAAKNLEIAKKHGIKLTEGEATGLGDLLYSEEMAREGKKGLYNQQLLSANKAENQKLLLDLARNLEQKSGKISEESGAEIQELLSKLSEKAKAKKGEVKNLYEKATETVGKVNTKSLNVLPNDLQDLLEEKFFSNKTAPAAFDKISMLKNLLEPKEIDLAKIHAWDKAINKSIRNTHGEDREALKLLKSHSEDYLDKLFEGENLSEISKTSRESYKKARAASKEYNKAFGEGERKDKAQKSISELIENKLYSTSPFTENEALNRIFGSSPNSFRTDAVHMVRKLKKLHPESEQLLRGEAAKRILGKIGEKAEPGKMENVLKDLKTKNKGLMKELFPEGIGDIEELSRLAKITNPGPQNPPKTAKALTQRGREFIEGVPVIGKPIKYGLKGIESLSTKYDIDPDILLKKYGKEFEIPNEEIKDLIQKSAQYPSANRPKSSNYEDEDTKEEETLGGLGTLDDLRQQLDNLSEEQLVQLINSLE